MIFYKSWQVKIEYTLNNVIGIIFFLFFFNSIEIIINSSQLLFVSLIPHHHLKLHF